MLIVPAAPPNRQLALVVPTFNEAANVGPLVARIRAALEPLGIDYEVIVVDDGSTDGTPEAARELAAHHPRLRVIVRAGERGLASAVVHGWQSSAAGVLGVMDADLQHPPELLPRLWSALEDGADLVLGSRYVRDASLGEWSLTRRVLSRLGIWMTALVLPPGRRISDPASGYFLVRREAVAGVPLAAEGFKILLEVLVRGRALRVVEVPFRFGVRQAGKSKGDLRVLAEYFALLWKLRRARAAARP